jgi:DNA mismatch endonuclease (patch repair protein)
VIPETRTEWWLDKIEETRRRDKDAVIKLNILRWNVITVWTCQLKKIKLNDRLTKLMHEISYI